MAPSTLLKAIGAVKDKTSIGLAKVGNSPTLSELEVAIVKATRHDEVPADEKHIREIMSLSRHSRLHVRFCIALISRRLSKTRSWTVALKTLFLIQRLLYEGDHAYEEEISFATRRGTRLLNMSDFRDTSRSDAWDFSAFVRTYALYLDERLDYRMHGRRKCRSSRSNAYVNDEKDPAAASEAVASSSKATPLRDTSTDRIFSRTRRLQRSLERFLACRPTGAAKHNRIVAVALYPIVKESFHIYYDLVEVINIFVERFMELEVPDCVRVHDIFSHLTKQFDELDLFYGWSKIAGICRSSEYPEIERITPQKLEVMDEFIRERSALATAKVQRNLKDDAPNSPLEDFPNTPEDEPEAGRETDGTKALPAPEADTETTVQENAIAKVKDSRFENKERETEEEADLLNLKADAMTGEEHGNRLALALFDGAVADAGEPLKWEAFKSDYGSSDWETALMATASNLAGQRAVLGGGFDMLMLDGMYAQAQASAGCGDVDDGSASSVVLRAPTPAQHVLALPEPPVAEGVVTGGDAFAASLMMPPPSYVQMSDMEKKQHLLTEEQRMWLQYAKDGMQGPAALASLQPQTSQYAPGAYNVGGFARTY